MADYFEGITHESALELVRARPAARTLDEWLKLGLRGDIEAAIWYTRHHKLREAIASLPAYLRDAPYAFAYAACVTLGALGAWEALPDLLDLLRTAAARERGLFGTAFFYFEEEPQQSALEAFTWLAVADPAGTTLPLLRHPDEAIRTAAARAVPDVLYVLSDPPEFLHSGGRLHALHALQLIGSPDALPAIRPCLEDRDPKIREAATAAAHVLEGSTRL